MVAVLKSSTPPLLISILFLTSLTLASSSSQRNATRRPRTPRPRSFDSDEDYSNYYDSSLTPSTSKHDYAGPPCHYDLCQDQQESCYELAQTTGCSCPGISSRYERPDPPQLRSLSFEGQRTVVVRWCAPTSSVTHYLVRVEGQNEERQTGQKRRSMELGYVAPGTEVCVQAVNRVGSSDLEGRSCSRFSPRGSESGLALKLGLIVGAVVLIVVLVLGLLVWRCRRRQKRARTGNRGA